MNEGGMGGLSFEATKPDRMYGHTLSEAWFKDEDGFPVLVVISLDMEDESNSTAGKSTSHPAAAA